MKNKNYLVTGASMGIGRAIAVAIAEEGGNVAINDLLHTDQTEEVAEAVRAAGGKALICQADVSEQARVEEMVQNVVAEFGSLDGFVSNAVYSDREPMIDADMDGFKRTIDVSMWGAFFGLRAASKQMVKQGQGGSVVIVSSPHAHIPFPTAMAYNMAKAAIDQMARTAAIELIKHKVRVNIMHPGWIDTPGERKFFSEDDMQAGGQQLPWGRHGRPEEIGNGVAWMLSDKAEYMTGSTVTMDGGVGLPWWSNREDGGL